MLNVVSDSFFNSLSSSSPLSEIVAGYGECALLMAVAVAVALGGANVNVALVLKLVYDSVSTSGCGYRDCDC